MFFVYTLALKHGRTQLQHSEKTKTQCHVYYYTVNHFYSQIKIEPQLKGNYFTFTTMQESKQYTELFYVMFYTNKSICDTVSFVFKPFYEKYLYMYETFHKSKQCQEKVIAKMSTEMLKVHFHAKLFW